MVAVEARTERTAQLGRESLEMPCAMVKYAKFTRAVPGAQAAPAGVRVAALGMAFELPSESCGEA